MATKTTPVATEDTPPALTSTTKWAWFQSHVWVHRPFYLWLPIAIALTFGFTKGYKEITQRNPIDDVPMGAIWNLALAVLIVILANSTKPRLFDDIDTRAETRWWRVLIDSCETAFLLVFFAWVIKR